MAGLSVAQASDLIVSTLPKLPRGKWTDTFKYQSYPFLERASGDSIRKTSAGLRYEARIRLAENLSARGVDLYEVTPTVRVKVLDQLKVEWVHTEAKVPYDARELAMNGSSDETAIIDFLSTQRAAEMESLSNWWEEKAFQGPLNATDTKNGLAGLPFWVPPLAAGVTDSPVGFNGVAGLYQDGTTTNSPGGLNASLPENSRWRSLNATIRGMTPTTVDIMRSTLTRVRFKAPPMMDTRGNTNQPSSTVWYMSMQDKDDYVRLTNAGSDPRRGDAAPFHGDAPMCHGVPIQVVPYIDQIPYLPIWFINHKTLFVVSLMGFWMKKHPAMNDVSQRNVFIEQIDCTGNIICTNRRANACLHRGR